MPQTNAVNRSCHATTLNSCGKIRVMLVDDSMILLNESIGFLMEHSAIEIVGQVCTVRTTMTQVKQYVPDLILLDVTTQGTHGLGVISELRAFNPALPIIVMDGIAEESVRKAALAQGASAYVIKKMATVDLLPTIWSIFAPDEFNS